MREAESRYARRALAADRDTARPLEGERILFEAMPQLGWIADATGAIHYYNRNWYEFTGKALTDLDGWSWQSIPHPDHVEEVVARWKASVASGVPFEMAFPLRRHDGTYRWFLTRATPVKDEAGKVVQWIGINADIDDQKKAEAALEEAVKVREELLAMVSHDLRNPMNAVLMAAAQIEYLVDDGSPPERVLKSAGIIKRAIDRMNRLVTDLLDHSRLEAGKPISVELDTCDATKLAAQAIEAVEPLVASRKIRLDTAIEAGPIWSTCDGDRVRQILDNLLGNAIKFTREGGSIRVGLRRDGGDVLFFVRDTGVGLREDQVPHVFSRYWQGDANRQRGVGLGLAIVKAIVDAHGGKVWVESKPDEGATFYFTIPAATLADTGRNP